jgi:hypothetical protein
MLIMPQVVDTSPNDTEAFREIRAYGDVSTLFRTQNPIGF